MKKTLRLALTALASLPLFAGQSASAATRTWLGTTDATWTTTTNWSSNAAPGSVNPAGSALSSDVAVFNSALANGGTRGGVTDPITYEDKRDIGSILFDTANVGAYVFNSGTNQLWLSHGGSITMNAAVTNSETFSGPVQVRLPSSTNGTYSFVNNATNANATLIFNGIVSSGAANTRPLTLTLDGANTGNNTITTLDKSGGQLINVVKSGAGKWVLSGTNNIGSGTVTVNNGTLTISGSNTFGGGTVTVTGGVLAANNNAALGTSSTANNNDVAINGGALEIENGITLDNGLSLNLASGGTVRGAGTAATNGRINVAATAALSSTIATVNSSDVFTIGNGANDFTGGASDSVVHIAGPGTVSLTQSSNYLGAVSIDNGALQLGSTTALGAATTANVTFGAGSTGKLQLNGKSITLVGLTSNSITVGTPIIENANATAAVLTANIASGTNTYAGTVRDGTGGGTLGVTKSGLGTLTLGGPLTYTGPTVVNGGGTLNIDFSTNSGATNSDGALTLGSATRGVLSITGKAATANTQSFTSLTIGAGSNRIDYAPGASGGTVGVTISSAVSPAAAAHGTLQFSTAGTTTLSGNLSSNLTNAQGNTYATYGTDNYAVTNGSGVVGAATYTAASSGFTTAVFNDVTNSFTTTTSGLTLLGLRFADATGRTVTYNTNTLTVDSILIASTAGTSALNGSGFVRNTRSTAGSNYDFNIIQNSANDFTIGANLGNASSSTTAIVKAGTGRLILSNTSNGYSAGAYINDGVLSISNNGNLGAVATGAAVNINGGNLETTANVTLDNSGANLRGINLNGAQNNGLYAASGATMTITGVVAGSGPVNVNPTGGSYTSSGNTITDTGTIALNNIANTFTGDININAGTLTSGSNGNAAGTGATSAFGQTNVARNINVNNGGTLLFGGGDQLIGNATTPSATLVINQGGTVTNNGASFNTLGAINLNGGTLTGTGGSGNTQFQMYQLRGTVTVGGTAASTISGSGNATAGYHLNGAITFNVADATNSSASDLNASASFIDGVGATPVAGGITKTGAGTMTLSGSSSYTGATTVSAGTLQLGDGTNSHDGTISSMSGVSVANGATLAFNRFGAVSSSFVISGSGSVTMNGSGTQTLSGNNTYTGATAIKAGTLIVSGSLSASSAVTVGDSANLNTAAILGGSGLVGNVTAGAAASNTGATVDPGNSSGVAGILNTGSLIVQNGAHLAMQIGGTTAGGEVTTGYDQVVASSTVTLTGGDLKLTLNGSPTFSNTDVLYLIVNNSGAAVASQFSTVTLNGSTVADTSNIMLNGQQFQLVYNANFAGTGSDGIANDVALQAVPEPSTYAMIVGGIGMLGFYNKLRRRRA